MARWLRLTLIIGTLAVVIVVVAIVLFIGTGDSGPGIPGHTPPPGAPHAR
jgi:hypothetical protein